MDLITIAKQFVDRLAPLRFGPSITHVYNPLDYARAPYKEYVQRYARCGCDAVLLGMNPGPWGMVQTGVPFGAVNIVRDWLGIRAEVGKPPTEHPSRPVLGFACTRTEVSGARLWGWARDRFGAPENFFCRFFVANYCPLAFFDEGGRNVTPDRLPPPQRRQLVEICDAALRQSIETLRPRCVVGVGAFAESRARAALAELPCIVGGILHPSPASPAANRGWSQKAAAQLVGLGISL